MRFSGGKALPMTTNHEPEVPHDAGEHAEGQEISGGLSELHWYALYTRSHCEQLVATELAAKNFRVFLPKRATWSRRAGRQHLISLPVFPSYLFLHHVMDKLSYMEVRKARGLLRVLGERWDRLGIIPDAEIEAIQRLVAARSPIFPSPYIKEGQRVRITHGPLAGTEGILVHSKATKGLLVLSVELLQRSVAIEIDCSMVVTA
jgi:transcription termination/antitermination protein NusG